MPSDPSVMQESIADPEISLHIPLREISTLGSLTSASRVGKRMSADHKHTPPLYLSLQSFQLILCALMQLTSREECYHFGR